MKKLNPVFLVAATGIVFLWGVEACRFDPVATVTTHSATCGDGFA